METEFWFEWIKIIRSKLIEIMRFKPLLCQPGNTSFSLIKTIVLNTSLIITIVVLISEKKVLPPSHMRAFFLRKYLVYRLILSFLVKLGCSSESQFFFLVSLVSGIKIACMIGNLIKSWLYLVWILLG